MTARPSLYKAVQLLDRPVFTTREIAAVRCASTATTVQSLRRMESDGLVTRVARGIWAVSTDPRFTVYALVQPLAGAHSAYVSLLSALRLHAMIEQIPQVVYTVTTGHTRYLRTPLGAFSFHHIEPEFFAGFEWHGSAQRFLLAEREKALVDCLYLSSRRGTRFRSLPELDFGPFDMERATRWVQKIRDDRIREYVHRRLASLVQASA